MGEPRGLTVLSLGAGVQSTTLALLAVEGVLPKPDVAIFADTGWEPAAVYAHVDRLEKALADAGVPLRRVGNGNLRDDEPDPAFTQRLPLYLSDPAGGRGRLAKRQCTAHYKLVPIHRQIRVELGAKVTERRCKFCSGSGRRVPPWAARNGDMTERVCSVCHGSGRYESVGRVPAGAGVAVQWIGFSLDEVVRVDGGKNDPPYVQSVYPLLDLGWTRTDCERYLREAGWGGTVKSACIGCPYHGNAMWRELRDDRPDEWAAAVAFDRRIRALPGALNPVGEGYLHRSMVPLDVAPIDRMTRRELADAQRGLFDPDEDGDPDGCSPFGCRSGAPRGGRP